MSGLPSSDYGMVSKIDISAFSIGDYDAAIDLWKRVDGLEIAEGDDRESIAQFLLHNPSLSRVARDGSAIVGVALCGHDGRRGHIYHLAVDPAYQGHGLGKRLIDECLAFLAKCCANRGRDFQPMLCRPGIRPLLNSIPRSATDFTTS